MSTLLKQIEANRPFGTAICQRMTENIVRLGFSVQTAIVLPQFDHAQFNLVTDPYSQSHDLVGFWYDARRQRIGQIKFHGDGSFFAEYDIVQPHPSKKHCFVEAINAWGNVDKINTEAKLLNMPQD